MLEVKYYLLLTTVATVDFVAIRNDLETLTENVSENYHY